MFQGVRGDHPPAVHGQVQRVHAVRGGDRVQRAAAQPRAQHQM